MLMVCGSAVASRAFLGVLCWWELWKDRVRFGKVAGALDCAVYSNRNLELSAL